MRWINKEMKENKNNACMHFVSSDCRYLMHPLFVCFVLFAHCRMEADICSNLPAKAEYRSNSKDVNICMCHAVFEVGIANTLDEYFFSFFNLLFFFNA